MQFGRYELIEKVGVGGMAEVWKASVRGPAGFEKQVAIKKVLPDLRDDERFVEMFINEAKLAATLNHPNVVQLYDFGQVGPDYFIAMEFVEGMNLGKVLARLGQAKRRLPAESALYVVMEAAKGLGHAHTKTDPSGAPLGLIHRDVSPQNLLLSFGGEVKVMDFGIAKIASAISRTDEGHVRGKLSYMSPEQAQGGNLDHRSDLFALGLVLYEILAGDRYFKGTAGEVYSKIVGMKPLTPAELAPIPPPIRSALTKLLSSAASERHANARELEGELASLLGEGIMLARETLGQVVQSLARERTSGGGAAVRSRDEMPTSITPGGASGSSLPLAMGNLQAQQDGPATAVSKTPTSGLTLSKPQPVRSLPVADAIATPRKRGSGVLLAGVGVFAGLAIAAGAVLFLTPWGAQLRGSGTAEPVPAATTAVALAPTATPTATIVASTSTSTPTPAAAPATPATTPRKGVKPPATPTPAVATPAPTKPVVVSAAAAKGKLNVAALPWVEVYVDGKLIAKETPVKGFELSAGKHEIRVRNPPLKFDAKQKVDMPAGGTVGLFVDVRKGTVELE